MLSRKSGGATTSPHKAGGKHDKPDLAGPDASSESHLTVWGFGIVGVLAIVVLVSSGVFNGASNGASSGVGPTAEPDCLAAYEIPAAAAHGLPDAVVTKAAAYDPARDAVERFKRTMTTRYDSQSQIERESGGFIDLRSTGIFRKTRDDVVEWRYLRNRRRRLGAAQPKQIEERFTHPMVAVASHCEHDVGNAATAQRSWWRSPRGAAASGITPYTLVRNRVGIFTPPDDSDVQLSRPTLLCVTVLTKPSNLHLALHQYGLWGRYCDEHWIVAPRLPADVVAGSDFERGFTHETAAAAARAATFPIENLKILDVSVVLQAKDLVDESLDAEDDGSGGNSTGVSVPALRQAQRRRSRWQTFRELAKLLDATSRSQYFEDFFFVDEFTYAVPENLYALLSEPQVRLLHDLGTPLLLGNRMTLPSADDAAAARLGGNNVPSSGAKRPPAAAGGEMANLAHLAAAAGVSTLDGTSDISTVGEGKTAYAFGSAFVLNNGAMRLFASRLTHEECMPHASLAAVDIALALCMAPVGVYPRDTSDDTGADRFLLHSVQALARFASASAAVAAGIDGGAEASTDSWYARHRPRPMPIGLSVISSRAVSFGLLATKEDMSTLHAWIHYQNGVRDLLAR